MKTEYNIVITLLFDNQTDRDTWYSKIKNAISTVKSTLPACKSIVATKGESLIEDTVSENL